MRCKLSKIVLAVFFTWLSISVIMPLAQAQNSKDTLNQYIADLQKNPNDQALREKIIKLALTMNPKPAMSQDVVMHEGAAEYAIKHAKTAADFADAAKEYEQALLSAPWVAADYFNCGVAYEKAEQYDAAVRNFNLYLATSPGAKDTNDVLKRIGGLEYAGHKAAKESSSETVAAQEQKKSDDWLTKIDGRRYTCPVSEGQLKVIDVRGKVFVLGVIFSPGSGVQPLGYRELNDNSRYEIRGRESVYPLSKPQPLVTQFWAVEDAFIISEDGDRITERIRFNDGDTRELIFFWQK